MSLSQLNVDSDDDQADSLAADKEDQCTPTVPSARPPPCTDITRQFGEVEGVAERCDMTEVPCHIRKAKLAWINKVGSRKTKQTCI